MSYRKSYLSYSKLLELLDQFSKLAPLKSNIQPGVTEGHTCNPSYSGGRDQEDRGSKPAQANSSARPYLEKPFRKIGLVE
jgi:hypothetical protein